MEINTNIKLEFIAKPKHEPQKKPMKEPHF